MLHAKMTKKSYRHEITPEKAATFTQLTASLFGMVIYAIFSPTFELVSHHTLSYSLNDLSAFMLVAVIQEVGSSL